MDAGPLEDVLTEIRNWFDFEELRFNGCEIVDGALPASVSSFIPEGAWYRVEGSTLNDGLHLHPATDLADETFDATIAVLSIPKPLLRLAEEIGEWKAAYKVGQGKALESPYSSESFGGYSYNRKDFTGSGSGWRQAFAQDLNRWRKI
jgi:hypothetical protein